METVSTVPASRDYAEQLDKADPLAGFRERFVWADESLIYLDGNSLGPLSRETKRAIAEAVDEEWGAGLVRSWRQWVELPRAVGDLIGEHLIGAAPGQVLVSDSTTVNLYKLANAALDAMRPRTVIITDDDNFPTDRYVLQGIAAQRQCELRMIHTDMDEGLTRGAPAPEGPARGGPTSDEPTPGGAAPGAPTPDGPTADALMAALDEDVALVCLSHVAYRSGALADMAEITKLVHDAGALMLWDLCHSAGAVPVELDACGADLAVGCTYKYLNAGPGAPAFLYVRSDLLGELTQPVWGWFGQSDQFAMGPSYNPVPGIERFATGTPPIVDTIAVRESVRLLAEAGIERLRAKGIALTSYLIRLADSWLAPHGFELASPRADARRGNHVTLRHPHAWQLSQALIEANVIGDYRTPDRLRLGPVPITTRFTDVWDGLDRLRRVAAGGSYLDLPAEPSRVT